MTPTDKSVSRVTTQAYTSRFIGWTPRKIVVTILPGNTLCLRLHGTRQREFIAIVDVFNTARSRRVMAEATAKRAMKKSRPKLRRVA
jgi:hypothetical protein